MRYIKLSAQYIRKNFLYIFPLIFIPAILIGSCTEPCSTVHFFVHFMEKETYTFGEIFASHIQMHWIFVLVLALSLPLICLCLSGLSGVMNRHMRYGILGYDKLGRRINFNFLPVVKLVLSYILLVLVFVLLKTCLVFIWINAAGVSNTSLALTIVGNVLLTAVMLLCMLCGLFVLPAMTVNGYNFRQAIAKSVHTAKSKLLSLAIAVFAPAVIPYTVMSVFAAFDFWWRRLVNPIIFILIFTYYAVLMFVAYYDVEDIDREDIKDRYPISEEE